MVSIRLPSASTKSTEPVTRIDPFGFTKILGRSLMGVKLPVSSRDEKRDEAVLASRDSRGEPGSAMDGATLTSSLIRSGGYVRG